MALTRNEMAARAAADTGWAATGPLLSSNNAAITPVLCCILQSRLGLSRRDLS